MPDPDDNTTFEADIDGAVDAAFDSMSSIDDDDDTPAPDDAEQQADDIDETPKAEKPEDDPDQPEGEDEPEKAEEKDPADSLEPPARWSAEDKAEFATLPRNAQELMLKRERQRDAALNDSLQTIAEQRKHYGEIDEVLSPLKQHLRLNGLSPAVYVARLANAEQQMMQDPDAGLEKVAKMFGAKWPPVAGNGGDDPDAGEYVDPATTQLRQEIANLKNRLDQQTQAQAEEVRTGALSQIQAFAAQPGHEHFETVRVDMAKLVQSGLARGLDDAYEKAVRMHPELAKAETAKADQARREADAAAAREKAAKADKARGIAPRSRAPEIGQGTPASIDATMNAVLDRAGY